MKIFGHYIFEDSPELKAYKQYQLEERREESKEACIGDELARKGIYGESPHIPMPMEYDDAESQLRSHYQSKSLGLCHNHMGKKYCYHTGTEIVTDL
jgi:hypothetical protein